MWDLLIVGHLVICPLLVLHGFPNKMVKWSFFERKILVVCNLLDFVLEFITQETTTKSTDENYD
jgi:hypothetical protein